MKNNSSIVWDTASQSTKWQDMLKIPGYAYGPKQPVNQSKPLIKDCQISTAEVRHKTWVQNKKANKNVLSLR